MRLTTAQRLICERIINVFETGSITGRYGSISIYNDGPHRMRQITYGRAQTTEYGNLRRLVESYANAGGTYSNELRPYIALVGNAPLVDNAVFKTLLRKAGNEDPVMRATQDKFFDEVYFQPASRWATSNGFTLPLSMLVIYDSFIHSGSILRLLRSRFSEVPPAQGGDERAWIAAYVRERHKWLSTHSNPDVRPSAYRTRDLQREVGRANWDLALLPIVANGTPVDDSPPAQAPRVRLVPPPASDATVPFIGTLDEADMVPIEPGNGGDPLAAPSGSPGLGASASDRLSVLRHLAAAADVAPAAERLIAYRDRYRPNSKPRYWAVVNFDLHSAKPRLFLFDTVAGTTSTHLCAHGRGSEGPADDGYAEIFSNADGSNCSSLGIYHCDVTYSGEHGKSLYLDGLEPTNSNARRRHIVIHGADYVSPEVIRTSGRIGRSLGCPALEMGDVARVVPALEGGSLMMLWKNG